VIHKRIVWDEAKNRINLTKHKLHFEEVASVFQDDLAVTVNDAEHSWYEFRFITIGCMKNKKLIVVFYTETDDEIRIISARKPTRNERLNYEEC
jgi:uncharacterized protein